MEIHYEWEPSKKLFLKIFKNLKLLKTQYNYLHQNSDENWKLETEECTLGGILFVLFKYIFDFIQIWCQIINIIRLHKVQ